MSHQKVLRAHNADSGVQRRKRKTDATVIASGGDSTKTFKGRPNGARHPPGEPTPQALQLSSTTKERHMEMQATGLVVLNGRLWVTPIDPHFLQCVARTRKGPRCRNLLSDGQVLTWAEPQLGGHGYVRAYDGHRFEETERWLAQHCRTHDSQDVTDIEAPEFRPFKLVHDAALLRPYRHDVLVEGELEAAR